MFDEMTEKELNPSIWYCTRVRESRNEKEHDHPANIEIAYILSGNGKYIVDGKAYEVKQGEMLICNPGVKHQSIVEDPSSPNLEFVCGFSDICFKNMPENTIITPDGEPVIRFNQEVRREISRCCYEIIEENYASQPGRYYMIKAQFVKILVFMYRSFCEKCEETAEPTEFDSYSKTYVARKIMSYLEENYNKKISLDKIAGNMYLSPVYISRIFKETTGDSPINYVIRLRLEKAKKLLETPDGENIKQIAMEVGYDDVYHFSKLFKKYYGISPLKYRKMAVYVDENIITD